MRAHQAPSLRFHDDGFALRLDVSDDRGKFPLLACAQRGAMHNREAVADEPLELIQAHNDAILGGEIRTPVHQRPHGINAGGAGG